MKLKLNEMKADTRIHCSKEEEANLLLEELGRLGYHWASGNGLSEYNRFECNEGFTLYEINARRKDVWYDNIKNHEKDSYIEFKDLMLPEITAEEVLIITNEMCKQRQNPQSLIPVCSDCPLFKENHSCIRKKPGCEGKVVRICAEYKAEKAKELSQEKEILEEIKRLKAERDAAICDLNELAKKVCRLEYGCKLCINNSRKQCKAILAYQENGLPYCTGWRWCGLSETL